MEPTDPNSKVRCSFCGKEARDVRKLIAGPKVHICDECVSLCREIIVEDDGPGIADGVVEQIFEPFYSTKSMADDDGSEGGTGIGLWLCAQIVEQHGGEIRAENRREGGARFVVDLPMAADAEES